MSQLRVPPPLDWSNLNSEEGHFSKECENSPNPDLLTCHTCGGTGHRKMDCPDKPKFLCSNCDTEGHRRNECPVISPVWQKGLRRNLQIWKTFGARDVAKWVILRGTVPIKSVAIVRNQGMRRENVLFSPSGGAADALTGTT
jgi:hypothetical protein